MCMPKIFSGHTVRTAKCVNSPRLRACASSFTACVSDFREGWRGGSSHTLQSRYWIFLTNQHKKSKQQVLFELCPCAKKKGKSICYTFIEESPHCLLCFWCHVGELFLATVIRFHSCYHFSTRAHTIRASKWWGRARDEETWEGEMEWVSERASEWASERWLWNAEGEKKRRRKTKSRAQERQRRRERKSIPCLEERPTPKVQLC